MLKTLMEPDRADEHLLISSELSSLYAPIGVHLNGGVGQVIRAMAPEVLTLGISPGRRG